VSTVKVIEPATLEVTSPLPHRPSSVALYPPRSNVPFTSGSPGSAPGLPSRNVLPASTVVSPVNVLVPHSVRVPVPAVVKASWPAPSSITPENVLDRPVVSTRNVTRPGTLVVTRPRPDKPSTVAL